MKFRDWLISEGKGGKGGTHGQGGDPRSHTGDTFGGPFWDLLYPTSPGEYVRDSSRPLDHFWLQWEFRRGQQIGRTLHNIDNKDFQSRGYKSIESPTAPDGGDGFWKHKDDGDSPSTKVVSQQDLVWIGDGKDSKSAKPIEGYNFKEPFGSHSLRPFYGDREKYLRDIFGDEASGKWPELSDDFDEPWLHKEGHGDFLGTGFHLYPTYAYDWTRATDSAKDIKLVKDRWKEEEKGPRLKFHNIDLSDFDKIPFKSVNSRNMPEPGDGFWVHKPDNSEEGAVRVETGPDLHKYGVANHADQELDLEKKEKTSHPFGDQSVTPPDYKLNQVFGDNPTEHGPEIDEKWMDSPFLKKYEAYMAEFATAMHGGIQDLPGSQINNNMPGIKSKISATDNKKEEPSMEKSPEKLFGFKKWLDKKKAKESGQKDIHKKRQGAPLRVPRVYT